MKWIALSLLAFVAFANADVLTVGITHPTRNTNGSLIPASGPAALETVTVQYGTCKVNGDFGLWEGGKTKKLPIDKMTFDGVPNRRTCTRAYWTNRRGKSSGFSEVFIARATT